MGVGGRVGGVSAWVGEEGGNRNMELRCESVMFTEMITVACLHLRSAGVDSGCRRESRFYTTGSGG